MARLTAAERRALPTSDFAGPNRTFPVNDRNHAEVALRLVGNAPPSAQAKIRREAQAKLAGKMASR